MRGLIISRITPLPPPLFSSQIANIRDTGKFSVT